MHAPARTDPASIHLDALRGIAALLVVIGHARSLLFVDSLSGSPFRLLTRSFYFLTSLGHKSVVVFFVLSGFLIGSTVVASVQKGTFNWREYAVARLSRLYVVLLPALLVGGAIDLVGYAFMGHGTVYGTPGYAHLLPNDPSKALSLPALFGNAAFLQTIRVPPLGTNIALWSLAFEFWYYVAFPLFYIGLVGKVRVVNRIGLILAGILILAMAGQSIALYMTIWMVGCGLSFVPRPPSRNLALFIVAIVGFLATLLLTVNTDIPEYVLDLILALTTGALIYMLLSGPATKIWAPYRSFAQTTSAFSYSLYLVHLPLLTVISAMILGAGAPLITSGTSLLIFFLVTGLALAYAYGIFWVFERRTGDFRRFLRKLLIPSSPGRLESQAP